MKLRVRHNSLRLRLTQAEVALLGGGSAVEESVVFSRSPLAELVYRVESGPVLHLEATFVQAQITIRVPWTQIQHWANSDEVGIEAAQATGLNPPLTILIEKDFACATARSGDETPDAFPNPAC